MRCPNCDHKYGIFTKPPEADQKLACPECKTKLSYKSLDPLFKFIFVIVGLGGGIWVRIADRSDFGWQAITTGIFTLTIALISIAALMMYFRRLVIRGPSEEFR